MVCQTYWIGIATGIASVVLDKVTRAVTRSDYKLIYGEIILICGFLITWYAYINLAMTLFSSSPLVLTEPAAAWGIDLVYVYTILLVHMVFNYRISHNRLVLTLVNHCAVGAIIFIQQPPRLKRTNASRCFTTTIYVLLCYSVKFWVVDILPWVKAHCFLDGFIDTETWPGIYVTVMVSSVYHGITITVSSVKWWLVTTRALLSIPIIIITFYNATVGAMMYCVANEWLVE